MLVTFCRHLIRYLLILILVIFLLVLKQRNCFSTQVCLTDFLGPQQALSSGVSLLCQGFSKMAPLRRFWL